MTSYRQKRIKRIREVFQKVETLMNEGYVVRWDDEVVTKFDWAGGLSLCSHNCISVVYTDVEVWEDLADINISEIQSELDARLSVLKKVEIKL